MQWNDEIIGLWPTTVLSKPLADASLVAKLRQLAADTNSPDADLFTLDDPAVARLREEISAAVGAYFKRLEVETVPTWKLRGRVDRLPYGASQGLKNAPGAYLRGVFYLETPSDTESLQLRGDTHPGDLTLYDPRPGFNMLSIKGDPYRNQALSVRPRPGLLLLWPAQVNDFRHPNLSRSPQLSIGFEVVPCTNEEKGVAEATEWTGEINEMWPTGLVKRRLPQHEEPNRELIGLIDDMERSNPDLTTDFDTNRFRDLGHPAVDWLMSHINRSVTEYFKQFKMNYPISWEIASWSNINRFGDYHGPHTHPWSYLSGTYYVQIPGTETDEEYQSELPPACISYRDPRAGSTALTYPAGSRFSPNFTIRPVPGALLMWPSAVYHFVHPNLSTEKRYSISFNIHLNFQPHYF